MTDDMDTDRENAYTARLRHISEWNALYWYRRCDTEHEKQDLEALLGKTLERALKYHLRR